MEHLPPLPRGQVSHRQAAPLPEVPRHGEGMYLCMLTIRVVSCLKIPGSPSLCVELTVWACYLVLRGSFIAGMTTEAAHHDLYLWSNRKIICELTTLQHLA